MSGEPTSVQAAAALGVDPSTTQRAARSGQVPGARQEPRPGSIQAPWVAPWAAWQQWFETRRPAGRPRKREVEKMTTSVRSKTHGFRVLESIGEHVGPRLIEVYPYEGESPEKRFYIVSVDLRADQVYSYLPQDHPPAASGGSQWCARYSAYGITYVANPLTEQAARRRWAQIHSPVAAGREEDGR